MLITYQYSHSLSHHYIEEVVAVDWFLMLVVRKVLGIAGLGHCQVVDSRGR